MCRLVPSSAVVLIPAPWWPTWPSTGQPGAHLFGRICGAAFDERPFARMVAERYGTAHTELVVEAPVADILPRLVWHYDEPFGDASAVPSYAIAALTRQHVTVVLNGDGGDENFAGYDRYITDRLLQRGDVLLPLRCGNVLPCSGGTGQLCGSDSRIDCYERYATAKLCHRPQRVDMPVLGGHFTPEERQSCIRQPFGPQW